LEVVFLGTGASHGIPVIGCNCPVCLSDIEFDKRLRSSVLIKTESNQLVIDVGPDFRQQMLREHINRVDAVLLTHEHKDHTAGLDDVRAFNYLMNKPMRIYAEEKVLSSIRREYAYVFAEKRYPGIPEMDLKEISEKPFIIDGDKITPIRIYHHKLPVLGFRINNFAYLTDIKTIEEKEKQKLLGLDVLVVSALKVEGHISHMGLNEALDLINELSPKKAYLTHISHMQHPYYELRKMLPDYIEPAYDGLRISL